jgi:hypothetical protein
VAVQRESGGLKTVLRVAGGTFPAIRAVSELVLMWIGGSMTVQTSGMGHGP